MSQLERLIEAVRENPRRALSRLTFRLWGHRRFGRCGDGTWVGRPLSIYHGKQIELGSGCWILEGARLEVVNRPGLPPGRIVIGDRVTMEQQAHVTACDQVLIEDDVCIAPRCTILDTSHPPGLPGDGNRVLSLDRERVTTRIGRRAFLGANVVVLPGVTIGENSVIGAGAVVNSDIAPNSVAAGVPARVIRTLPR